jgi:hypothetical protein
MHNSPISAHAIDINEIDIDFDIDENNFSIPAPAPLSNVSILNQQQKNHLWGLHQKCRSSQWMHEKSSYYFQKWSFGFTIPSIIVNSVMAVLSTLTTHYPNVIYVTSTVFLLNAILTGLKEFFKFDKRVQFHIQQSTAYEKLANQIEVAFVSSNRSRSFKNLVTKYISLIEHRESLVPEHISSKLDKISQNVNESSRSDQIDERNEQQRKYDQPNEYKDEEKYNKANQPCKTTNTNTDVDADVDIDVDADQDSDLRDNGTKKGKQVGTGMETSLETGKKTQNWGSWPKVWGTSLMHKSKGPEKYNLTSLVYLTPLSSLPSTQSDSTPHLSILLKDDGKKDFI